MVRGGSIHSHSAFPLKGNECFDIEYPVSLSPAHTTPSYSHHPLLKVFPIGTGLSPVIPQFFVANIAPYSIQITLSLSVQVG